MSTETLCFGQHSSGRSASPPWTKCVCRSLGPHGQSTTRAGDCACRQPYVQTVGIEHARRPRSNEPHPHHGDVLPTCKTKSVTRSELLQSPSTIAFVWTPATYSSGFVTSSGHADTDQDYHRRSAEAIENSNRAPASTLRPPAFRHPIAPIA